MQRFSFNALGAVALVLIPRFACGAPAGTNDLPLAATAADPQTYLSNVSATLATPWPRSHTVNIVCHGHSVPSGYFKTPLVDTFNAYPHLLHRGLKERFPFAVINVIVTAIGGEESESGARRFERDVLTLRPEVVTIDYSLNDRRIGLARAEAAWRTMITNATAHGIKVILLTPTPDLAAKFDDPSDPLNQHAAQVRRLAREYGVGLVDSLAQFQEAVRQGAKFETLMAQGNHPNRQGHDLVVAELLKWWLLPPAGKISGEPTTKPEKRRSKVNPGSKTAASLHRLACWGASSFGSEAPDCLRLQPPNFARAFLASPLSLAETIQTLPA